MLTPKLINYFKDQNWWFEEEEPQYREALMALNIDIQSDFAKFYLHVEDNPTFLNKKGEEIYQIGWFLVNSDTYLLNIKNIHHPRFNLSTDYLPLDMFEGEYGYFYNQKTGEVVGLGVGKSLQDFLEGKLKPQWDSFSDFLAYFFDI